MIKKIFSVAMAATMAVSAAFAGGLLTNTNQNVEFLRNPARDAAIGIDGVYSNPAGVAFLNDGFHLAINWQNAHQTRTVNSTFGGFANGINNNGATTKEYKGVADAPVLPSLQFAYNRNKWSFQFNFAVSGGGGKCEFEEGLGSFESLVSLFPAMLNAVAYAKGVPAEQMSKYNSDSYMRGRQYYFGGTLGAAYRFTDQLSGYAGFRVLYGSSNYYGYVKNICLGPQGNVPAAQYIAAAGQQMGLPMPAVMMLTGLTRDITLNCDQTGWGVAPILGLNFKLNNKFNFAAKYEFRTHMNLSNRSANSESAESVSKLARFKDGEKVREDSPALLTLGAQWSILPSLRVSAGWHYYFDKDAEQYGHAQKLLGNTQEYLFGVEYDINKLIQVSAGGQRTAYDMKDDYMSDLSFNVSSYSFGLGLGFRVSKVVKLNVAYFQTLYGTKNVPQADFNHLNREMVTPAMQMMQEMGPETAAMAQTIMQVLTQGGKVNPFEGANSYTRTNRVIGIGANFTF